MPRAKQSRKPEEASGAPASLHPGATRRTLAKAKFLATTADESDELIATEPINAGGGIALADGESYDVTLTIAAEP